jgi:hypothetical protein
MTLASIPNSQPFCRVYGFCRRGERMALTYDLPAISWRKLVLLKRAALAHVWSAHFPRHDFGTGRLMKYPLESFERACDEAEAKARAAGKYKKTKDWPADDWGLDRTWSWLNDSKNRPTPQTVVEAIWYCIRERGPAALEEPANLERLSRCDAEAKAQIDQRIEKLISNAKGARD